MKPILKSAIILVFLMIGAQLFAQVPFTPVPNSTLTINGELKIIGNAIVGLNQRLSSDSNCSSSYGPVYTPNDDYNGNCSNNRKVFGYIDIDGDPSTFSSSSADLILTSGCEKIAYAGLYWSASYFVQMQAADPDRVEYRNLPFPDNRPDFRTVKIKPPGGGGYITIPPAQTQVIYDGYRNTATNPSNSAVIDIPYVCYADVTSIIQGLGTGNANGTYTVADMRAATGYSGDNANGISGGWVLVVAYEDPNLSAKYISTNNGYLVIAPGNAPKSFTYSGFQTLPSPLPVRARYAIATLEGDQYFNGDVFQIERPDGTLADISTSPANLAGNFFDSSISVDGGYGNAAVTPIPGDPPIREPHSRNTLGFDADIFNIPNPSNTIIANDQTSARFFTTSFRDAYSVFFNSFQIEIIEPELTVKKRVLDVNGIDITGDPVDFGQQLFYELTIENQGNEAITAATIRDVLPANVDFTLGSITTSNPGIVATPNGTNREIDITIDDALIVRNGGIHTVRFGVSVVATCADLRDACSNEIKNTAVSTYTGVDSGTTKTGEQSILDQDACNADIVGSSNVLINNGICFTDTQPAFICTGSLTLTAGAGFTRYEWVNASNPGAIIGTNRDLVVTVAGTYIVTEFGAPTCQDSQQTFEVDAFNTVQNPVVNIVNGLGSNPNVNGNLRTCAATGEPLPEIFLCGAGTTLNIPINFPIGTTVVWERMDPADCPSVVRDPNCPTTDAACNGDWVQVSTDIGSYTVTQAGEYRIRATFDANCTIPFYFNVFQNNFDPDLDVIRDIICGTPGTIHVKNSSNQYEYQLKTPSGGTIGYQNSAVFTGLTEKGNYTVNVRQRGGQPTACVFQDTEFLEELDATETVTAVSPRCPGDRGEISITVADSQINYTYIINGTKTGFTNRQGPTTIPSHVFTGLAPDTYEVQVLSADDSCSKVFIRDVNAIAPFSATIRLLEDLHCNPGYQPDPTLNDPSHPNYDPTALPFDPDQFIAIYEVTVIGGSGDFSFNSQNDFLGTTLVPLTTTTYQFRATAAGNYPVYVNDLNNNCTIFAGSVGVNPYTSIAATATSTDPVCPSGTGSILVNITAGKGPFTYILNQGTVNEVTIGPTVSTTETFNNVDTSTSHVVTVQDRFGCDLQLPPINFTAPTVITADIDITQEYRCDASGSSATPQLATITVSNVVNGNGSYEYSIDGSDFTNITGVFTSLTNGTYTVYIRDTNTAACPVNLGQLKIDPLQEVTDLTFAQTQAQCPALTSDVTVSATGTNGASSFEYRITAPAANTTAFSTTTVYTLPVGNTYTFEARTTTDGCIYSENYKIDAIDPIAVSANITAEPTCDKDTDASFTFTVTGIDLTSTTYSFVVTGGTIIGSHTGNTLTTVPVSIPGIGAGTYNVLVTDDTTLCTATAQVTIKDPADLTIDPPKITPAGCGIDDGTITVTANGGRGGYQYELRNATGTSVIVAYQGTNSFTGLAPNIYTVFVRDGNTAAACEESVQAPVGEKLAPVIALATGGDPCYDPINRATQWVTITPGVAPPIGPFTYSLDGGAPVAVTFLGGSAPANTFEVPNLTPGAHTISVINTASVCPSNTINFTVNNQLTITAVLDNDLTCIADARINVITNGGNGATSLEISINGGGFNSYLGAIPFTTNTAGEYQFRVIDSATPACTADSAVITVNPAPDPVVNLPTIKNPTCNGDSDGAVVINIDTTVGTGPYQVNFNGLGFSNQTTYGGLIEGTYNYTVRDAKGCTDTFSVSLSAPPIIIDKTDVKDIVCNSAGITLGRMDFNGITGGVPPYSLSLLKSVDLSLATTSSTNPVTGVAAGSNISFDGLSFGKYILRVIDHNKCSYDFIGTISTTPIFDITSSVSGVCSGGVTATINVTGGTGPFQIREYTPGGTEPYVNLIPGPTTHVFTNLPFDTKFTFEVLDTATNCTDIRSLDPPPNPSTINIALVEHPVTCVGSTDGSIDYTITNYQGTELTYSIYRSNDLVNPLTVGIVYSAGNPQTVVAGGTAIGNVSAFGPGKYLIRVEETDGTVADACNTAAEFTIVESATPFTYNTTTIIAGHCNASSQGIVSVTGGTGPYGFLVVESGNPNPSTYSTSNVVILNQTINSNWDLYVTDANNCELGPFPLTATVIPDPTFTSVPAFVVDPCINDSMYPLTVIAIGQSQLEFGIDDGDTGTLDAPVFVDGTPTGNPNEYTFTYNITNVSANSHTLTIRDANGCTDTATITVYPELLVTATSTPPTCRDNDATIIATVSGGSDITANPGNFTFTLLDGGGSAVVGVTQTPGPGADQITFSSTVAGTNGIFPGDYTVEVNDSAIGPNPPAPGGCTASVNIRIPRFLDPIPSGTSTPVSCFGGNEGTILVSLDPTADDDTPYNYIVRPFGGGATILGPQTDLLFVGLPAGSYEVVATSKKGCSGTSLEIIIGGPKAALNVVPNQTPYGCNVSNADVFPVITLTITGGTAPYDVSYTGAATGSETDVADADGATAGVQYNVTATVAGTYTFTVTDNKNCAFATFNYDVPVFPIMTNPLVTQVAPISCNAPNAELVEVSVDRSITPANLNGYRFDLLGDTQTETIAENPTGTHTSGHFSLTAPGSYVFRITDLDTGCSIDTEPYRVAPFDTITATLDNEVNVLCAGATTGGFDLTIGGYTGAYNYTVTNTRTGAVVIPSTGANTTTNPLTISGLSGGTYHVSVVAQDAPFCREVSNTATINQPTPITVTVNQIQDETCNPGEDATVEAVAAGGTGAFQYQLETSGGIILVPFGTDPRFGGFGLDAGVAPVGLDYVVRVRDANNCEITGNINIQPPVPIGLNAIAPTTLVCADSEDGIIVATATGGQGAGTYFFMLTFPDGSQSGRLSSTTDTYRWEDLKPGNYIVTVSDNLNCNVDQNPVVIDAPPAVTIDVTPTGVSCLTANPNNIQVIPGGGIPGYEFGVSSDNGVTITWQVSDTFLNLPTGDYDFYVRDRNLCESPASTRIQVRNPNPFVVTLDLSNTSIVCFSEPTGSIDAVATGGLGNYMYSIAGTDYLGGVVAIGPQTSSFFGDLLAGNYTYTVTSGDCVDNVTPFTITQPLEFRISVTETPITCNGETDGSIRVEINRIPPPSGPRGGTAPYFYSLYNSAGKAVYTFLEDDIDNLNGEHTFIDLPADTYRVEVEDGKGCPVKETNIIIIEPEAIAATITATTPEDCAGDMNGTATVSITGGLPPANPADPSYFWSIDGVNYQPVSDPANLFIDNLPGGTTTLFVRDSQNNANCQGAFNIEIEPGVNLGATLIPRLGCPVYDYSEPRNPVMTREEQYFVEFNIIDESRDLGITYTLNGINGTPNPANNSNLTGVFEVTPGEYEGVMEFQGCTRTVDTIEIFDYTPLAIPVAQMTGNSQDPNEYQIIASGGRRFDKEPFYSFSFTILEDGMTLEQLEPSDFTELDGNIFAIRKTADYVLRVVDADGCEVLTVQNITYINIRIPNYFTPDSPNTSIEERFWYPRQITPNPDDPFFFENMEVVVFDRYGRMLAEFKGDQQGWDGLYQGKQLPSGDYWYTIILNDIDNREFTGHFTLYR